MNGTMLDVKELAGREDEASRYGRYDIVYVMLDKRIDGLSDEIKYVRSEVKDVRDEIKDVRSEVKDVRGEIKDVRDEIGKTNQRMDALFAQTNQRMDALFAQTNQRIDALAAQTNQRFDTLTNQMVSMKTWGIGLLITVLLVVLAPHIASLFV